MRSWFVWVLASGMLTIAGIGGCGSNKTPPLSVVSPIPADGATGVAVNTTISVTFNQTVYSSDLTNSTFTLTSSAGTVAELLKY